MPLKVVAGGVEKPVVHPGVIVNGSTKTVRRIEAWNGTAWKVVQNFAPAMSANMSSSEVYGSSSEPSGGFITTGTVTCSPVGGLGPYSYTWTNIGGASASATSPGTATTAFTAYTGPSDSILANFTCVVADSLGQTAAASVVANFSNFSPL